MGVKFPPVSQQPLKKRFVGRRLWKNLTLSFKKFGKGGTLESGQGGLKYFLPRN